MTGAPPAKRTCTSVFPVVEQSRQQVVMTWIFGYTPEGVLTTVLQTPTGVQIPAGVELKLGQSLPRKLPYVNCDQQRCEATIAMDAAFSGTPRLRRPQRPRLSPRPAKPSISRCP